MPQTSIIVGFKPMEICVDQPPNLPSIIRGNTLICNIYIYIYIDREREREREMNHWKS